MVRRASCGKKRANSPSQKALSAQRRASRCLKDWNLPELIGLTSGPRGGGGLRPHSLPPQDRPSKAETSSRNGSAPFPILEDAARIFLPKDLRVGIASAHLISL
jgi:hypothetical protein